MYAVRVLVSYQMCIFVYSSASECVYISILFSFRFGLILTVTAAVRCLYGSTLIIVFILKHFRALINLTKS